MNLSWKVHLDSVLRTATKTGGAVSRFYYPSDEQYVPAAVKAFNAEVSRQ